MLLLYTTLDSIPVGEHSSGGRLEHTTTTATGFS